VVSGSTFAMVTGSRYGEWRTPLYMLPPMAGLNLSPGERVIFEGHPSWRAILGFYLKGILLAAVSKSTSPIRISRW
jgi:hypothetical protein